MDKNKRLSGIFVKCFYTLDEVGEDDLFISVILEREFDSNTYSLATTCGQ